MSMMIGPCGNLDTGTVFVIMSIAHAQSIFMPINVRPVYCHHSFVSYARPSGLLTRLWVSICQSSMYMHMWITYIDGLGHAAITCYLTENSPRVFSSACT